MRYYGIVGLLILLVASVAVYAFATGGSRRLLLAALALIPVLAVVDIIDRLGTDEQGVDWLWVVASAVLPFAAAFGVRFAAALRLNRGLQWLFAFVMAVLAVIIIGVVMAENSAT
jgi:hypothetical protein